MRTVTKTLNGREVVTEIWMVRGDDETILVPLTDADGAEYAMQEDDTLTLTVRETPSDDSPVLAQITGAPGSNRIPIAHADTAQMEPGRYSADIQLITGGLRRTVWPDYDPTASNRYRVKNMQNFVLLAEVTTG